VNSPREIQKARHAASEIAHMLMLLHVPRPLFVRFVPGNLRTEVELELLSKYRYVVTSWGELVLSPGIHHLGPAQVIEFQRFQEPSLETPPPATNDDEEDEGDSIPAQDMFPLLLAFFAIILLMATSMWIGNP
jgi:hypothetical protein